MASATSEITDLTPNNGGKLEQYFKINVLGPSYGLSISPAAPFEISVDYSKYYGQPLSLTCFNKSFVA